MINTMS